MISCFYFNIIFTTLIFAINIFSEDKINISIVVQNCIDEKKGKCNFNDIFSEKFNIDKSKFNKEKYTGNELMNFIKDNSQNFKNFNTGDKIFFIQAGGRIFFKEDHIESKVIKLIKNIHVYLRDKRKYDFKIYERYTPKKNFQVNNKTYTYEDLIKTCLLIDERINNENCCILTNKDIFFITKNYPIFKKDKNQDFYITDDYKINPLEDFYFEQIEIKVTFYDNTTGNIKDLCPIENVYDILNYICEHYIKEGGIHTNYEDIIKIKYDEDNTILISEELKNKSKDKLKEELKNKKVKDRKNIEVYLKLRNNIKEKKKKKKKEVDKILKKKCYERCNC